MKACWRTSSPSKYQVPPPSWGRGVLYVRYVMYVMYAANDAREKYRSTEVESWSYGAFTVGMMVNTKSQRENCTPTPPSRRNFHWRARRIFSYTSCPGEITFDLFNVVESNAKKKNLLFMIYKIYSILFTVCVLINPLPAAANELVSNSLTQYQGRI